MTARRQKTRRAPPLSPLAHLARFGAVALALGLASCGVMPTGRYSMKSDAKPHSGVVAAHGYPIHGIDLSKWQGRVDWAAVKAAGTQFAFIKATEGGDHVDPKFIDHWYAAKRNNIPRGAYHFMYWCRPAEEQARWFKANVPQDPDALPPVLDLEWNGASKTCPRKVSREQALEMTRTMLVAMQEHTGKRPIIYTDITFHSDVLEGTLGDYPYWVRSVAAEPHQRYNDRVWTFWQFTTTGRVPGIDGDVDRNTFYGTENQWQAFLATDCDPRQARSLEGQGLCQK